jgi:hypothetical protein
MQDHIFAVASRAQNGVRVKMDIVRHTILAAIESARCSSSLLFFAAAISSTADRDETERNV